MLILDYATMLFHWSNIKKELEVKAGLISSTLLSTTSLLHCNPNNSKGPTLLINKYPTNIMGFWANATAYVHTQCYLLLSLMVDLMMIEDVFAKYIYRWNSWYTKAMDKCVASGVQSTQLLLPSSVTAALDESHRMKVDRFVQNMNEWILYRSHSQVIVSSLA